jgi:hypothetical protein
MVVVVERNLRAERWKSWVEGFEMRRQEQPHAGASVLAVGERLPSVS